MSDAQRRPVKKLISILAAALVAGAAAVGGGVLSSANAAEGPAEPTTITATAATVDDAVSAAWAQCSSRGYNADRILGTATNADGSVTVTMECYTI